MRTEFFSFVFILTSFAFGAIPTYAEMVGTPRPLNLTHCTSVTPAQPSGGVTLDAFVCERTGSFTEPSIIELQCSDLFSEYIHFDGEYLLRQYSGLNLAHSENVDVFSGNPLNTIDFDRGTVSIDRVGSCTE